MNNIIESSTVKKKYRESHDKYLLCYKCEQREVKVSDDTIRAICWLCVLKAVEPPVGLVKEKAAAERAKHPPKQRGWQFMKEYVDEEGYVYHKGVEQPELKDTLPTTPKKKNIKKSFNEKLADEEKNRAKLIKRYEKAKKEKKKRQNKFTNKPIKTRNKK